MEKIYTPKEVAEQRLIGYKCVRQIRYLIKTGRLKATHIGVSDAKRNTYIVSEKDIKAFLNK